VRYKDQKRQPGAEEALRRIIGELSAGEPRYDRMASGVAQTTSQQLPRFKEAIGKLGAVQSVSFTGVLPDGAGDYVVKFANGDMEWRIALGPDGKILILGFHPL
jgi:bla regulator protein BlaR1